MSAALLPLDQVKALLGITGNGDDAALTAALPVVTELFEKFCLRGLAYVADVVEQRQTVARFPLFRYPVEAVSEVIVDELTLTPVPVAPQLDAQHGFIYLDQCEWAWPYGYWASNARRWNWRSLTRVTYSGGYKPEDVPADLALAFARCCADLQGVNYTQGKALGGETSGAPLKALGLGSGALTVSFDTGRSIASDYNTSSVPPLLAPYHFVLDHYQMKDFV